MPIYYVEGYEEALYTQEEEPIMTTLIARNTGDTLIIPEASSRILTVRHLAQKRKVSYYALTNTQFVLAVSESDGGGYNVSTEHSILSSADFVNELQSAVSQS